MKKQLFPTFGIVAVLTTPLALPPATRAQVAHKAACQPSPPSVQITVDYVTTSLANSVTEASRIAPGGKHDALLLAALLKDGAQHIQSSHFTVTADSSTRANIVFHTVPPLTSFIQAKPRINKNGSITIDMTNHLETLLPVTSPGAILPSVEITDVTGSNTFTDGQTLMVNSMSKGSGQDANIPSVLLIFAKVESVAKSPLAPAAALPLNHP